MSFIGFFSKDEDRGKETVRFEDFREWFMDELGDLDNFKWKDVGSRYEDIENSLFDLRDRLDTFKGKKVDRDIAPRLKNMAESNRKVLISRLQSFIDSFELPSSHDYETAHCFIEEKSRELDEVSEKIKKSLMVLDNVQPKETKNIVDALKKLEGFIGDYEVLQKVVDVLEKHNRINERLGAVEEINGDIDNMRQELNALVNEKEELQGELDDLKDSRNPDLVADKEEEMDSVDEEIRSLENSVRGNVAPFKRGFKKLGYLGVVDDVELLEAYVDDPAKAVNDDKDLSFLIDTVDDLNEKLGSGDLDFSSEEVGRLEDEISSFDPDVVLDHIDEIKNLRNEKEELEGSIDELNKEKEIKEMSRKLKRKNKEIDSVLERIDKKEAKRDELMDSISDTTRSIEYEVSDILDMDLDLERVQP